MFAESGNIKRARHDETSQQPTPSSQSPAAQLMMPATVPLLPVDSLHQITIFSLVVLSTSYQDSLLSTITAISSPPYRTLSAQITPQTRQAEPHQKEHSFPAARKIRALSIISQCFRIQSLHRPFHIHTTSSEATSHRPVTSQRSN